MKYETDIPKWGSPWRCFLSLIMYWLCWLPTSSVVGREFHSCGCVIMRNKVGSSMTWYSTHSHHPDTDPPSPGPILIMPSTWLGSCKYRCYKTFVWLDHAFELTISDIRNPRSTHSAPAPSIYSRSNRNVEGKVAIFENSLGRKLLDHSMNYKRMGKDALQNLVRAC